MFRDVDRDPVRFGPWWDSMFLFGFQSHRLILTILLVTSYLVENPFSVRFFVGLVFVCSVLCPFLSMRAVVSNLKK